MHHRKFTAILAFGTLCAHAALAADPVSSADLLAMGRSGVASSANNFALLHNPGLIALDERYDIGVVGTLGPTGARQIAASVVDAQTSKTLALGFTYVGDRSEPEPTLGQLPGWSIPGESIPNVRREHTLNLSLGTHALQRRLSFGLNGTVLLYNHDLGGSGITGNLDAGVGAAPTDWLVLGVAGRNLLPIDGAGSLPITGAAGASIHGKPGQLLLDGSWQQGADEAFTAGGGVQLPVGEYPTVRFGYRYDGPALRQDLTAGFGVHGPDGGFDFGVALPVTSSSNLGTLQQTRFALSLSLAAPRVGPAPE